MISSLYLPAVSASSYCFLENHTTVNKKLDFRYFNDDTPSPFYHNGMLMSAAHFHKQNGKMKSKYGIDKNKMIFLGDSGGYSIATGTVKYSDELRKSYFDWMDQECTYGMNLDIPPHNGGVSGSKYLGDSIFQECLKKSIINYEFFKANQSKSCRFMNVLHGRSSETLNDWYSGVERFTDHFEGGWGIGSASFSLYNMLLSLFYLYEKGEFDRCAERNVDQLFHILGFSKISQIAFVSFFQKKISEKYNNIIISFDSSSCSQLASTGQFVFDISKNGLSVIPLNKTVYGNINDKSSKVPCTCPVCEDMTIEQLFKFSEKKPDSLTAHYYSLMEMHNLYAFLQYKEKIERFIQMNSTSTIKDFFTKEKFVFDLIEEAFASPKPFEVIVNHQSLFSKIFKPDVESVSFDELF